MWLTNKTHPTARPLSPPFCHCLLVTHYPDLLVGQHQTKQTQKHLQDPALFRSQEKQEETKILLWLADKVTRQLDTRQDLRLNPGTKQTKTWKKKSSDRQRDPVAWWLVTWWCLHLPSDHCPRANHAKCQQRDWDQAWADSLHTALEIYICMYVCIFK